MVGFSVEPLGAVRHAIEGMLPAQWGETGDSEVACNPNWKLYGEFDQHNALLLVMARKDGVPIGYLAAFIYPHPNAVQELKAEIPTYFVAKGPVRALVMDRMIDFALERLAAMGVFKIEMSTSAEHSAARLLERKGFNIHKIGYSLKLKPKHGAQHA